MLKLYFINKKKNFINRIIKIFLTKSYFPLIENQLNKLRN